jgi:hypothetical protein
MGAFGQGQSVSDTTLMGIKEMIASAGTLRALVVALGAAISGGRRGCSYSRACYTHLPVCAS